MFNNPAFAAFETQALIKRNAWEYRRKQWATAHPVPTITERLRSYEYRHARFTQDLYWFPAAMWLGTAKRD